MKSVIIVSAGIIGQFTANELHNTGLKVTLVDRQPASGNLYINSGYYRNGLALAPASARLLREIILQTPTSLPEKDYAPCNIRHQER